MPDLIELRKQRLQQQQQTAQQQSSGDGLDALRKALRPAQPTVQQPTVQQPTQTVQMPTVRQKLLAQQEPEESWYKGDQPTSSEVMARIYTIGQTNPNQASQLWDVFQGYQKDPSSPFYNPYTQSTNKAVQELEALGFDMSKGVTQEWLNENSWLKNYYRMENGNTPLAPSAKSTQEQNAAYWYYQLLKAEGNTQQAENEWAALQEEIQYWVNRKDRNYSDDEILGMIDWSNYKTLTGMDEDRQKGLPTVLNRGVGYSQDALRGVIWAARNGSAGDPTLDSVQAALGAGKSWQEDAKITAKLDPTNEAYSPYSTGSTLDDAALYFGVANFDRDWLDQNRSILAGNDATAKRYYDKVYNAEQNTQKAEAELAGLWDSVDEWMKYTSDPDVILSGLLDDCPTLKKMDESLKSGDLMATTRAVDYRWQDVEAEVRRRCAEVNTAVQGGEYVQQIGETLGYPMVQAESDQAVQATRDNALNAAGPTIMEAGTEEEKAVFQTAYSADFDTYVGQLADAMQNGDMTPQQGFDFATERAGAYARDHYWGAVQAAQPYQQTQDVIQQLEQQRNKLKGLLEMDDRMYSWEERSSYHENWSPVTTLDVNGRLYYAGADFDPKTGKWRTSTPYALPDEDMPEERQPETQNGTVVLGYSDDGEEEIGFANSAQASETAQNEAMQKAYAEWLATLPDFGGYAEIAGEVKHLTADEVEATREEIRQINSQIKDLNAQAETQKPAYDSAQEEIARIDKEYSVAAEIAELCGLDQSGMNDVRPVMDYLFEAGSEWEPTDYQNVYTVYDAALMGGYNYDEVADAARQGQEAYKSALDNLSHAVELAQEMGISIPADMQTNIDRRMEWYQQQIDAAEWFLAPQQADYQDVVEATREAIKAEYNQVDRNAGLFARAESDSGYTLVDMDAAVEWAHYRNDTYMPDVSKEDRDRYLYIRGTQGKEEAFKFYQYLQECSDAEFRQTVIDTANEATKSGPLGAVGMNILAAITAPLELLPVIGIGISAVSGVDLSPNNRLFATTNLRNAVRSTSKEEINNATKDNGVANFFANLGYDLVTNMADNAVNMAAFGGVGSGISNKFLSAAAAAAPMALEVGAPTWQNAKFAGASDDQALAMAGVSIFAEWITETIEVNTIVNAFKTGGEEAVVKTLKQTLLSGLADAGNEAVGEAASEVIEQCLTYVVQSEIHGKDPDELNWKEIGEDAMYAALLGGLSGEAFNTAGNVYTGSYRQAVELGYLAKQQGISAAELANRINKAKTAQQTLAQDIQEQISTPDHVENAQEQTGESTSDNVETEHPQQDFGVPDIAPDQEFGPDVDMAAQEQESNAQLAKQLIALTSAMDADEASQTATVSAALLNENANLYNTSLAIAAGEHLSAELGAKNAVELTRDILLEAGKQHMNPESVKVALTIAALGKGQAATALQTMGQGKVTADSVNALLTAANADMTDSQVMQRIDQTVTNNQVATQVKNAVSEGAALGLQGYETALEQAKTNERNAQADLEQEQEKQTVMGQNLQSVQSEYVTDPTNAAVRGAVQQAIKDLTGQVKVVGEYAQQLANAQTAVQGAQATLDAQRDALLKQLREQAQQDVVAARQENAQQEAQQQYDDAVAKLQPAAGFDKVMPITLQDGTQIGITGIAYLGHDGSTYFSTDQGGVIMDNAIPVDQLNTLLPVWEPLVNMDTIQALQNAPHPIVSLDQSLPAIIDATGEVVQVIGFAPTTTDQFPQMMLANGEIIGFDKITMENSEDNNTLAHIWKNNLEKIHQAGARQAQQQYQAQQTAQEAQNQAQEGQGQAQTTQAEQQATQTETASAAPVLASWQDPAYHGTAKAARKLRTNTQNFKNWFSDPTGDLTNADGTPKVIYRGTASTLRMEHKAPSKSSANQGTYLNFYSPDIPIARSYAHGDKHVIKTYDITNWETAAKAMEAEGYELRTEQNSAGEWGYRAYGVKEATKYNNGAFYHENELSKFNKEYGGIKRNGLYAGYLSLKKPLVIDAQGAIFSAVQATVKDAQGNDYTATKSNRNWAEWARGQGYDSVIVRNSRDYLSNNGPSMKPGTVIMTFEPSSFKSLYNTGKLGKKNPDIRYHKAGTFALTGENISTPMKAVLDKLALGQKVSLQDILATPEIQWAEEHQMKGESVPWRKQPYTPEEMQQRVTPERFALQQEIQEDLMDLGSFSGLDKDGNAVYDGAVAQGKRLDIVIGPPAAGKSSALVNPISQKYQSRVLDSDMVKERLPEYQGGLNSGYLHTESRYIWEQIKHEAMANGDNIVLPVVGHSIDGILTDAANFKNQGYTVNVHYLELDGSKAMGRALNRFLEDGRYIDPSYLAKMSDGKINTNYAALKGEENIDGYSHWDNDVKKGEHPKLLEDSGEIDGGILGGMSDLFSGTEPAAGGLLPQTESGTEGSGQQAAQPAGIKAYKGSTQQGTPSSSPKGAPKQSPQRIAKDLARKLGLGDAIGTKKMNNMPQQVAGYYEQRAKYIAVRNRQAGNYAVNLHEVGHSIADLLGMTGTQNMVNSLDPVFAANYTAAELPGEAFAEFMWRYMADEQAGRAFAGDAFVDDFEHRMQQNGIARDVHNSANQLRAWINASVNEQIGATIRNRSEKQHVEWAEQFRRFIDGTVDATNAAEAVNHAIREQSGQRSISLDQDIRANALMKNFANRRSFAILTQNLTDSHWTRIGDSLADVFDRTGLTAQNEELFWRWELARHSMDRDAQGKPVFDAHITSAARQQFIQDTLQQHPEFAAVEQGFQQWRKDFLQALLVDTGYLSQDAFDRMNAMYPHYVPTQRVKDGRANRGARSGSTYQVRTATGSTEDIWNPLDSFINMVDSVVTMVSANNAALAWDNAYHAYSLGEFGREITPDSRQVSVNVAELQQQVNDLLAGNVDDDIFRQVVDLIGTRQSQWVQQQGSSLPNVLTVQMADGSQHYYEIFDTELYKLLASVNDNSASHNQLLSMLGRVTRGMSALTTGSNPVFAVRNFMRDFQNSVNYGSWASNYASGAVKWLAAAYDVWRNRGEYQDYVSLGGGGWTRIETGTRKGSAEIKGALYKGYNTRNVGSTIKWAGQKLWNAITLSRLNEIVEQTSRYAEYKYGKHDKSTAAGRTEAFLAGQEATVDFARNGNGALAGTLKQLVPFFGASMQGVYRTSRMLTEAERGRAPVRFAKTVLNTALMSALCNALLMKNSDDDDKEEFARMSDQLKAQHFYLPNFAPEILGQQPLVRIPVGQDPLMYAVHGAVTNAMWNGTTDEAVIELAAIANTILDNLNPLGSGTILQPIIGIGQNKNWYGSRIVPSRMENWDPTTQYTGETPDVFVQAGRITGMSPLNLQYLAEQYTGFLGQMLIPALSKNENTGELGGVSAAITAAQKRLTSDPLISNDVVSSFYDGASLLTQVTNAAKNDRPLNMLRRGLTPEEATAAYEEAKEMTNSNGIIGQTKKIINSCYSEIDDINANDTLTPEQKYTLTSEKRREMIDAALEAQAAIGAYKERYITGQNVATNALFEGAYAHIPDAYDKMDQTFKDDSDEMYMQRANSVWEATGKDSALPHPNSSFTFKKQTYEIEAADWDNYTLQYKMAYQKYLVDNGKMWDTLDTDEQLELLKKAHTAGHNAAVGWYKKLHGIK